MTPTELSEKCTETESITASLSRHETTLATAEQLSLCRKLFQEID